MPSSLQPAQCVGFIHSSPKLGSVLHPFVWHCLVTTFSPILAISTVDAALQNLRGPLATRTQEMFEHDGPTLANLPATSLAYFAVLVGRIVLSQIAASSDRTQTGAWQKHVNLTKYVGLFRSTENHHDNSVTIYR